MIIGISGKIGSGKSHIARQIQYYFSDYDFQRKSFGYDIKKIVSYMTGINLKTVLSRKAKTIYLPEWDLTIGQMFQKIGTDCMRNNLHPDSWILSLFSKCSNNQNYVIDDVRFFNEADAIKERGGIIIRLNGDPKNIRATDKRDPNHRSEVELDNYNKFDIIFENHLSANIDELMELIKVKISDI